jgi:hypothetical protein
VSLDKKFCAGCQTFRFLSEGQRVLRNKNYRWICNVCLAKTNKSPYTKVKKVFSDDAALAADSGDDVRTDS